MKPNAHQIFSQGLGRGLGWKTAEEVGAMPPATVRGSPGSSTLLHAEGWYLWQGSCSRAGRMHVRSTPELTLQQHLLAQGMGVCFGVCFGAQKMGEAA